VRITGVALMLASCSHATVKQAPAIAPRAASLECVLAWTASNAPSGRASLPPHDGGYRLNADKAVPYQGPSVLYVESKTFDALTTAVRDLAPELRECMQRSDPVTTDLQYVVTVELVGDAFDATMTIGRVSARRLTGFDSDGSPVLVQTAAEACMAHSLQRLELPAGLGPAEAQFDLRYNDCGSGP
jgi:hypothetical protein